MRKLLLITTTALILTACGQGKSVENAADKAVQKAQETISKTAEKVTEATEVKADVNAELDAWFENNFMEGVRRYPQFLAQLGVKERTDEWNDPSRTFALESLDYTRQDLAELKSKFNPADLDESRALSYRLFVEQSEDQLAGAKWWYHRYNFNQMFGAQSGIPTFLLNNHRIDNVEDAENYIKRLNGVDEYLGEIVKNSQASAAKGIMPPKFVYDHVIRDSKNVITGAPYDDGDINLILADFQKKVEKLELEDDVKEGLYEEAIKALLTSVKPAYDNLVSVLKAQKAKTNTDDGAWKLPDGEAFYKYRLKQSTTTDMTADEVHDLGLKEVGRIHGEMRDIMKKVDYDGTLQEFFEYLRVEPKFYYEDSDAGREAYLKEATRLIDVMKTRLDDVFLRKPKADLEVVQVEAFREKSAGKAFYNRPSADGKRPGKYYANLYKITDMPKYQMEALAYHEGIPGHHMQLAIAQELEGIPKFRKFGSYTAYTEGWGLYSEFLPKEMGFYEDHYSDFGRLAMELWRAARLVVDTGLHDKEWTREKAIDYLTSNTPNPENDCIKAIERYIVMPGQATAYKIGMIKIQDLRNKAKKELGSKFDIREFHDVVLASGAVPLNVLEERVDTYIEETEKN